MTMMRMRWYAHLSFEITFSETLPFILPCIPEVRAQLSEWRVPVMLHFYLIYKCREMVTCLPSYPISIGKASGFQLRNAHKETMSMKPLPRTNPSLTHSLPLWHQMMSFANWFLHVCRTSYDLLLQFPLFLHSKLEWRFRNEHFWPAKLLWETILRSNFHQRYKCFGRERVETTSAWFFRVICREGFHSTYTNS